MNKTDPAQSDLNGHNEGQEPGWRGMRGWACVNSWIGVKLGSGARAQFSGQVKHELKS